MVISSNYAQDIEKRIDWGIKGGFNSDICMIDNLNIDGSRIDYSENTYRVGVSVNVFLRLNIDKVYIQFEPGYQFTRGGLEFTFIDKTDTKNLTNLSWEFNNVSAPLLVGYHFINEPPYRLSFFAGPKISKIFKSKNNFRIDQNNYPLDFDFRPIYSHLVCGVGLSISNLFFDFRYEFGLVSLLKDITYSTPFEQENPFGRIELKNRMNSMTFSMGYIF